MLLWGLLSNSVFGQGISGTGYGLQYPNINKVQTSDGATSCYPSTIEVSPATLTCNPNGTAVITNAGGGSPWNITDGVHTVDSVGLLTITGGTVGGTTPNATLTVTGGSGTNYWNLDVGNIGINTTYNVGIGTLAAGNALTVNGTVNATSFTGAGTGLTGTAGSLNIGGNATTATTATNSTELNGQSASFYQTALGFTPYNATNPSNYIALTALSGTPPVTYNNSTGAIGIGTAFPIISTGGNLGINTTGTWNGNAVTLQSTSGCTSGQGTTGINTAGVAQNCTTYSQQTFGTLTNTDWCNTNGTSISCTQAIPVTSFTGDSLVLGNSSSTGAVTATTKAQTQNTVLGAATSTTLAGLAVPSCSGANNALNWTSNVGFGCSTISGGASNWLYSTSGNIGLSTTAPVGIGTTFVGGAGMGGLSVMSGNVGIGTWIPNGQLDVEGNYANTSFYSNGATPTAGFGNVGIGTFAPIGNFQIVSNATTAVGIGTANPGQPLDVQGEIRISALGSTLAVSSGSNGCTGQGTLSTGTVTISTTCTPATSQGIFLTDATGGVSNSGTIGIGTFSAGTSFEIQSSNALDNSKVNWWILKST